MHCLIILHKFNAWASTAGTGDWRVHTQMSMKTCFTWFKVVGGHWTDSTYMNHKDFMMHIYTVSSVTTDYFKSSKHVFIEISVYVPVLDAQALFFLIL